MLPGLTMSDSALNCLPVNIHSCVILSHNNGFCYDLFEHTLGDSPEQMDVAVLNTPLAKSMH